jgi:hypothetical protein
MKESQESIQCTNNLLNYFRQELRVAFDGIGLQSSENTEAYLVYLLENFVRLDPQLSEDVGFQKAAALLLGEAMNSPGDLQIEAYRRLGDASLFNCGFFDAHLTRRGAVTSQYYRDVGRIAYGQLSDLMMLKRSGGVFQQIYEELAAQFDAFVEAFKRLGDRPDKPRRESILNRGGSQYGPLEKLRRGESLDLEDLKLAGLVPANTTKKK